MFKKLTSSFLAVAMLASMGTTVFASEGIVTTSKNTLVSSESTIVEPRYVPCDNCLKGHVVVTRIYSGWVRTGTTRKCNSEPFGDDLEEERIETTTERCDYCGVGDTYTATQTRWICYGHTR